jgi:hypothetical protein
MDIGETMNVSNNGSKNQQNEAQEHREGPVARMIEQQTAKIPSDVFLWAAGASIVASLAFEIFGTKRGPTYFFRNRRRAQPALFIGQWAPTLLLLGIYNKIVKVAGSDRVSQGQQGQGT